MFLLSINFKNSNFKIAIHPDFCLQNGDVAHCTSHEMNMGSKCTFLKIGPPDVNDENVEDDGDGGDDEAMLERGASWP